MNIICFMVLAGHGKYVLWTSTNESKAVLWVGYMSNIGVLSIYEFKNVDAFIGFF